MLETPRRNRSFPIPNAPSRSILIIEDDRAVRTILELVLRVAGHQVETVTGFAAGRAALDQAAFDLVLLDLQLPDGDGLDLLRHLRQSLDRSTPVIVLSASRPEENRPACLELGANDYLSKPFSSEDVIERVRFWTATEGAA